MSSMNEIANELLSLDTKVLNLTSRIQREQGEINDTMNKAQPVFGNQEYGQRLVTTLYKTLQNALFANSALDSLRQDISGCVNNIHK